MLVIISLIWGCSFILIKKSLVAFSPVQLGCLRLGISSVAFSPVIIYYRKEIEWKRFFTFVLAGLTGSGIPAFLFAIAQTRVTSSVAGMLNSMTPIWTLILGGIFFSTGFSRLKVTGVLSGFVGASALLWYGGGQNKMGVEPFYGFLILFFCLPQILFSFYKPMKKQLLPYYLWSFYPYLELLLPVFYFTNLYSGPTRFSVAL
ncbi:MAG: DMT family transporter [Saprospiraceae bacterium]|nr:DMT family transporter [Saprospiraceae bacterium]